uniref:group XIIB secretory phospholipase A2-like protein n=1 Tax=Centroberyx gerrardi TaxID=166262 RepID=UPI003AAEA36C
MLPRTVVLLVLCLSSGMCATLGHYQANEEEEAPAVDTAAVEPMGADGIVGAAPAAVDLDADRPVADEPVAEEQVAESNTQTEDVPLADSPAAEDPVAETLVGDEVVAETPAADSPAAEEPAGTDTDITMGDMPAADAPAVEALTGEALAQEEPAEEEGNEIEAVQADQSLGRPLAQEEDSGWGLNSIRGSFQTVSGYFDSLVELVGGRDGVCQYRCRYGKAPQPRPGYQVPEPNGCVTSLGVFQVDGAIDLGIPAMTKCCDQLDMCYDTCGTSKYRCDSKFRWCLHGICSDLKKSLGFVSKVQACESVADGLYNTVWTLGCRPYMNSQRAACLCEGEEKDEL